jgi:guanine nucleotide-binding protein G(i) subunit alpha
MAIGGDNYDKACEYWANKFQSLNQSETKEVYVHFTCATDTSQIKFVMAAVNNIIITNNLRDNGLL